MADELTKEELTEAFEYLDKLRVSGRTNMWGAASFMVKELGWPSKEADAATGLWMNTFSHDLTVAERVAKVNEEASQ